jgi:hypothetical protein
VQHRAGRRHGNRAARILWSLDLGGRAGARPVEVTRTASGQSRRFDDVGDMIAVGTRVTSRPPQSGRIEARTGLRMMPTFPRSPLSFRTAGFPRYGWKAGMSGGAFPSITRLSLLPAFTGRYLVCVRRSCTSWSASVIPHSVGPRTRSCTALEGGSPSAPGALALVRVMLSRPVITYSAPSAPPAGTSRFHRMAAYTRCLRCAGAPRRPASGSELSLHIPS